MKRKLLFVFLFLSVLFCGFAVFYKTYYWGFSINPVNQEDLWMIEAHINFEPMKDENINLKLSTPTHSDEYKILQEDIAAKGYKKLKTENGFVLSSGPKNVTQDIYYKAFLFDSEYDRAKVWQPAPKTPKKPIFETAKLEAANKILSIAEKNEGNWPEKLIALLNKQPVDASVLSFMPHEKSDINTIEAIIDLLHLKAIPARVARGVFLEEEKVSLSPDVLLEVYLNGSWRLYDINTGKIGVPEKFILFQRGAKSLLDVEGGVNSSIKFSVLRSFVSPLMLAEKRAEIQNLSGLFDYSLYSLPLATQGILKWLSIFPLAILIVVIMRNIVGLNTMGTFTPMLIALSLVKTGFFAGLLMFFVMISIGLLLRFLLSKFNLLLVPRISAVVIFVVLIMQLFVILGYNFEFDVAKTSVFFPIIIMAWIIERASITWEEDGSKNAITEIVNSLIVAVITYFIIANHEVRHVMFAFNELNLLILAIVMLLGTYTGYRLTELARFKSLAKN